MGICDLKHRPFFLIYFEYKKYMNKKETILNVFLSNLNVCIFFIFKKIGELKEEVKEKQFLFLETC